VLRLSDFVQIGQPHDDGFCPSVAGLLHLRGVIPIWNIAAWFIERLEARDARGPQFSLTALRVPRFNPGTGGNKKWRTMRT
jgi:hypothetical protein